MSSHVQKSSHGVSETKHHSHQTHTHHHTLQSPSNWQKRVHEAQHRPHIFIIVVAKKGCPYSQHALNVARERADVHTENLDEDEADVVRNALPGVTFPVVFVRDVLGTVFTRDPMGSQCQALNQVN